jgi:integrase/recombinase XerD
MGHAGPVVVSEDARPRNLVELLEKYQTGLDPTRIERIYRVGEDMSKAKIDWHTRPACEHRVDIALKSFKRYLTSLGLRNETIKLYSGRVGAFLDFAGTNEPSTTVADEFRDSMIDKGLSRSHINNTCFAVKKFYEMKGILWSFTVLRTNEGIPYYFSESDVTEIFGVCTNIKHLAMLQTLFYGCLRSSELCKLEDNDLDLEKKTIRLRETKGGRDDVALITEGCVETMRIYLTIRPQKNIKGRTPLFYTDNLNLWEKGDVHRMFLYYKKKAGIKKPGAVHVFSRHTPATILVAKGCDIRIVKEVLRHRDIRTTLRYAHVADKTKRERYEQYLVL